MVTDKAINYQPEKSGVKTQVFFYVSALVIVHAIPPPIVRQKPPKSQVLNLSESLFLFISVTDEGINYQTEKSCVKTQVYFMLVLW